MCGCCRVHQLSPHECRRHVIRCNQIYGFASGNQVEIRLLLQHCSAFFGLQNRTMRMSKQHVRGTPNNQARQSKQTLLSRSGQTLKNGSLSLSLSNIGQKMSHPQIMLSVCNTAVPHATPALRTAGRQRVGCIAAAPASLCDHPHPAKSCRRGSCISSGKIALEDALA